MSPKKCIFSSFCSTEAIVDRAMKLGPHIKNTWEFCWQFKSCKYIKNSLFCGVLKIYSLFWTLRIEYEMFRMRSMVTNVFLSSDSKILDNCFVLLTEIISYESLKHIYGFRDKWGCPVAQRSPKDSISSNPLR